VFFFCKFHDPVEVMGVDGIAQVRLGFSHDINLGLAMWTLGSDTGDEPVTPLEDMGNVPSSCKSALKARYIFALRQYIAGKAMRSFFVIAAGPQAPLLGER
jgi:hypothetical protein